MSPGPDAVEVVRLLRERGETIGTAESLTGGLLCAALVDVPGASDVVVGGLVAYATQVKTDVLGIDPDLVDARGTVDPDVAVAMATSVHHLLGSDWGVSTTGVAGPGPSEGK
ncbi:MAG: nicotinamide-nucleotide amidohydrolase family protein, partial [Actinomycetales bacterium]